MPNAAGSRNPVEPAATAVGQHETRTARRMRSPKDRENRRFIKNMIVWVFCSIVLLVVLMLFLMQGA